MFSSVESARLSVALDLRNPFCYLALGPSQALVRDLGVDVQWLPLTTPPLKSPSTPSASDDRGILHRRARARALAFEIETYAQAQGVVLRDYYRNDSAEFADLGWLWLLEHHPERLESYLTEVFRAYWATELDPSRIDGVAAQLEAAGAPAAAFRSWCESEGPAQRERVAEALRRFGLFQAPAFVLEGEVFYGRQHLPMLRWILEGRDGPIPI